METQSSSNLNSRDFVTVYPKSLVIVMWVVLLLLILLVAGYIWIRYVTRRSSPDVITCTSSPPAPQNLSAQALNATQFLVRWTSGVGATENLTGVTYTAYVGTAPGFNIESALMIRTSSSLSLTIDNLPINRNYYIVVKAENSCGSSPPSAELSYFFTSS